MLGNRGIRAVVLQNGSKARSFDGYIGRVVVWATVRVICTLLGC